jgi:diguanylate cyclase (GGDEF)-like protein
MSDNESAIEQEARSRLAFSKISHTLAAPTSPGHTLRTLLRVVGDAVGADIALLGPTFSSDTMVLLATYPNPNSGRGNFSAKELREMIVEIAAGGGALEGRPLPREIPEHGQSSLAVTTPLGNYKRGALLVALFPYVEGKTLESERTFLSKVADAFGLTLRVRDQLTERRIAQEIIKSHHAIADTVLHSSESDVVATVLKRLYDLLRRVTRTPWIEIHIPRSHLRGLGEISFPYPKAVGIREGYYCKEFYVELAQEGLSLEIKVFSKRLLSAETSIFLEVINDLVRSVFSYVEESDRALETRLRTSRLAKALDSVPTGVMITGLGGKVTYWNLASQSLFGFGERDEPHVLRLVNSSDSNKLREMMGSLEPNVSKKIELLAQTSSGTGFPSTWIAIRTTSEFEGEERIIWTVTDQSARANTLRNLEDQANRDYLTGMYNMRALMGALRAAVSALEEPFFLGVVFVDLDDFKSVNDTYGHHVGDALLKIVGKRIESSLRKGDIAGRISGDEFLAILPVVASTTHAARIVRRITRSLSEEPAYVEGVRIGLSASVGYAITNDPSDTPEELIRRADHSMYVVKRGGRLSRSRRRAEGSIAYIEPSERLVGEALADALSEGHRLSIRYSALYDLSKETVSGITSTIELEDPRVGKVSYPALARAAEVAGLHFQLLEGYLLQLNEELEGIGDRYRDLLSLSSLTMGIKIPRKTLENRLRLIRALKDSTKVTVRSVILELDHSALESLGTSELTEIFSSLKRRSYHLCFEIHDDVGSVISLLDASPRLLKLSPGMHNWRRIHPLLPTFNSLATSLGAQLVATAVNSQEDFDIVSGAVNLIQGEIAGGIFGSESMYDKLAELRRSGPST